MKLEFREINMDLIEFISGRILNDSIVIAYIRWIRVIPVFFGILIKIKLAIKNNLPRQSHW